jgi:hypothetical protein
MVLAVMLTLSVCAAGICAEKKSAKKTAPKKQSEAGTVMSGKKYTIKNPVISFDADVSSGTKYQLRNTQALITPPHIKAAAGKVKKSTAPLAGKTAR